VNFKTLPLLLFFFCCSCDITQQQELPKNEMPEKVQDKELHAELPVKKPFKTQEKKPSKALPVGQDRTKSFHNLESSTIQGKARHDYPPENLLE
jgi:hypothetical protein